LLIFVYECLGDVGMVSVFDRGATDERRPIRNRLLPGGGGKIFARGKDRGGGANCAERRHKNVLRGDGDNRTSGAGICVYERVGGDGWLIEHAHQEYAHRSGVAG